MVLASKGRALLILGITAVVLSRALFFFFNDPEGPNLLVVMVAAAGIYAVSLTAYGVPASASKKFWLACTIQVLSVVALYLLSLWF